MKQTRALMGMTITVEIADSPAAKTIIDKVFSFFENVENKFSVFKTTSEITLINNGKIKESQWSKDMKLVFAPLAACVFTNAIFIKNKKV